MDRMLDEDEELDEVVRVMLKLNRWGGLRISELVALQLDCLRVNHTGGVWVEYYMTKTKDWRRFPLPEGLAQLLRDHQSYVRSIFGEEAHFMFRSLKRSSRVSEVIRPWSTAGLRNHTYKAFIRNGISKSAITGEYVSGASIHRSATLSARLSSTATGPRPKCRSSSRTDRRL
nr:tyrosine-type recombinase/integrase [Sanguibacter massiliensis]